MDDDVAVLRSFDRASTQRIGVPDDRFPGRGRPVREEPQDRRLRVARLTTAGQPEWTEPGGRSDRLARELRAGPGDRGRRTRTSTVQSAERSGALVARHNDNPYATRWYQKATDR